MTIRVYESKGEETSERQDLADQVQALPVVPIQGDVLEDIDQYYVVHTRRLMLPRGLVGAEPELHLYVESKPYD